jgi:hypothetical protein
MLRGALSIGMLVTACGRIDFDSSFGGSGAPALDIALCPAPPELSVSRASAGTYTDATGVLRTAAVDAPRCDYDATTGALLGLLVEGRRTNYVGVSFGSGSATDGLPVGWDVQQDPLITAVGTSTLSPTFEGFRETAIHVTNSGGGSRYFQIMLTANVPAGPGDYVFSWFIRAPDPSGIDACKTFQQTFTADYLTKFAETESQFPTPTASWSRVSMAVNLPATAAVIQGYLECQALDTSSYTITVAAPQIEEGLSPSSPILTDGNVVTREPDVVTLDRYELANGDRGTVVLDVHAFDATDQLHTLFQVDDTSAAMLQRLGYDAGAWTASFPNATSAMLAASLPGAHQLGYRFAPTASAVAVDGAIGIGGPVVPLAGNTVRIGASSAGDSALFGDIARLRYWPTELADGDLVVVTTDAH